MKTYSQNKRNIKRRENRRTEGVLNRKSLEGEIWATIKGYLDYEISNCGRVFSLPFGVIMSPSNRRDGGVSIKLRKLGAKPKSFGIHRLVALAFIPNPNNKPEVDHIDNNRRNNHVSNLQWATRGEQIKWAYERGRDRKYGENSKTAKLTNRQVVELRNLYQSGTRFTELRDRYNISESSLSSIIKRRTYKTT